MLIESNTNDVCCTSVCFPAEQKENTEANVSCPICNEKCRVSLIEIHVDICLRRENNEFRLIADIMISNDESDDKSCVNNCEMEIQREEKCLDSRKNWLRQSKQGWKFTAYI